MYSSHSVMCIHRHVQLTLIFIYVYTVYTGMYEIHLTPIDVHTQVCTVHCTAHIHKCTCIHRHVHLTPIYICVYTLHRHVQLTPIYVYTQACTVQLTSIYVYIQDCTPHTHIRVYTGMYSSHLYSCIYRIVQLTSIYVYIQDCTPHTYIRAYTLHKHVL